MSDVRAAAGPAERAASPRLGLRFDRGRTELVLESPLALAGGARLDAMRAELAPLSGRLSLSDGWRAFRHRRSSLVSATWSIGLSDLAASIGRAVGVTVTIVAAAERALSIAAFGDAMVVASELAWAFDDEDLVILPTAARSLPEGPRPALGIVFDLGTGAGLSIDRDLGVLRWTTPLRRALMDGLAAVGLRVPATRGLSARAVVDGSRVVVTAERLEASHASVERALIERARASAAPRRASVDGDDTASPDPSPVVRALDDLHRALADGAGDAERIATLAASYASLEPHPALASSAFLAAAERAGLRAPDLASRAIERGGLRSTALARAVELASSGADASATSWGRLAAALDGTTPVVLRARGLALERAGRLADALAIFAELVRLPHPLDARTDLVALAGLARCASLLGRHDDAIGAWDRVAGASDAEVRDRARLDAAMEAIAAGHVDGAIARLRVVREAGAGELALRAHERLVALTLDRREVTVELDRSLPALTDASGAVHASLAADLLRAAFARATAAADAALARSVLDALGRVLGDAGTSECAVHASALAALERRARTDGDPEALRTRADALRASGRGAEAARVLVEVFARTNDAAFLRAAIELADRSTDRDARREVFERALELLPAGPARDAIAARRG